VPGDRLAKYRQKRHLGQTPEPFSPGPSDAGGLFVMHQHGASHLHWDLRLEMNGVLVSWAVPKGASLDPDDKRAAFHVEDHPLSYGDFEGVIPAGNYGAGPVIVWDRGRWVPIDGPKHSMEDGKLLFDLHGYKLQGRWTLVRIAKDPKAWLLIKKPDRASAKAKILSDTSVLSGLTLPELGSGSTRIRDVAAALKKGGAKTATIDAKKLEPMLAETAKKPFDDPKWLFELKYDGYRLIAEKSKSTVTLRYRSGNEVTRVFPELARALASWPVDRAVIDGEVVVLDDQAKPSFNRLQGRAAVDRHSDIARLSVIEPVTMYAFDLLQLDDLDLRALPLEARKAALAQLVPSVGPVRYTDHVDGAGIALYAQVEAMGLEGIMAKDRTSAYKSSRSDRWLKVRVMKTADFAVVGFTTSESVSRTGFSALHLATHGPDGFVYAGKVGGGFDEKTLIKIHALLEPEIIGEPPCSGEIERDRHSVWTRPKLAVEVRYSEWIADGQPRFPVFLRLRDDKKPQDCIDTRKPVAAAPIVAPPVEEAAERKLICTNPQKVFWPDEGYTKLELYEYYRTIWPFLAPYLRDRPVVVVRYPDGIAGKSFFQKDAPPSAPSWLRTERMWSDEAARELDHFVPDDLDGLLYLVNLASIPLHVWGGRLGMNAAPDWCVIDLDPKSAPFSRVIEVAKKVRELCDALELPSFPKTSGASGMHVLIPLGARYTYAQSRALADLLARVIAAEAPDIATVERRVEARNGRVYVDSGQNGAGKLIVSAFSVRPVKGAKVSMPLAWREVNAKLDPSQHTIKTALPRLEKLGKDPLSGVLGSAPDLGRVLERLAARMK